MKFSDLLLQREALRRQARLANFAFAFNRLTEYARRVERAGLRGHATLHPADSESDRLWPALVAHEVSQAVVDEHFLDEDVEELDEILLFLESEGFDVDFTFDFAELAGSHLPAIGHELEKAGIALPRRRPRTDASCPDA